MLKRLETRAGGGENGLAVELASLLLLGALVVAYHLGREDPR